MNHIQTDETKEQHASEHQAHPPHVHPQSYPTNFAEHSSPSQHAHYEMKSADPTAHVDHAGHEQMFRDRFWICALLSIPVLVLSPVIQEWLGLRVLTFAGSEWITPLFSIIIFWYGGFPFLRMAIPEIQNRQPGMMTLISLAISVAFVYSLATLFANAGIGFFWELVTLIDVMLLGHWIEMRSVRQASRALDELTKLMPDTAERIRADGNIETVAVSELKEQDFRLSF